MLLHSGQEKASDPQVQRKGLEIGVLPPETKFGTFSRLDHEEKGTARQKAQIGILQSLSTEARLEIYSTKIKGKASTWEEGLRPRKALHQ